MTPVGDSTLDFFSIFKNIKEKSNISNEQSKRIVELFNKNDWVDQNKQNVKEFCDLLDSTTLEGYNQLHKTLLKDHPQFFQQIVFTLQGESIEIPKSKLILDEEKSEFFKAILGPNFLEGSTNKFDLPGPGSIDQSVIKDFLGLLKDNKINITGENAAQLLVLADFFRMENLQRDCSNFLKNACDKENAAAILESALNIKDNALTEFVITFMIENLQLNEFDQLLNDPSLESNLKELINLFKECKQYRITPQLDNGKFNIDLGSTNPKAFEVVGKLHQKFPIYGISSPNCHFEDADLIQLSQQVPNLKSFHTSSPLLKNLPPLWQNSLEKFSCKDCELLTDFEIPTLKELHLEGRSKITNIYGPNVTSLSCKNFVFQSINCPNLKTLWLGNTACPHIIAPNATSITLNNSSTKILEAENAENVTVTNCPIEILKTPNVKKLTIEQSNNLHTINAEKADSLTLKSCGGINSIKTNAKTLIIQDSPVRQLDASLAEWVYLNYCPLTNLNFPKAKNVKLIEMNSLTDVVLPEVDDITITSSSCTSVSMPKATKMEFEKVDNLQSIDGPNVLEATVKECPCTTITLPKVKILTLEDLADLSAIIAREAITVKFTACNFTLAEIPNATNVHFDSCRKIKDIDAPSAKYFYITDCDCESVNAPMAKKFTLIGCQKINRAIAPEAIEALLESCSCQDVAIQKAILCRIVSCSELVDANFYDCENVFIERCNNLKNINASKAKIMEVDKCGSISKIHAQNLVELYYKYSNLNPEILAPNVTPNDLHIIKLRNRLNEFEEKDKLIKEGFARNKSEQNAFLTNTQKAIIQNNLIDIFSEASHIKWENDASNPDRIRSEPIHSNQTATEYVKQFKDYGAKSMKSPSGYWRIFMPRQEVERLLIGELDLDFHFEGVFSDIDLKSIVRNKFTSENQTKHENLNKEWSDLQDKMYKNIDERNAVDQEIAALIHSQKFREKRAKDLIDFAVKTNISWEVYKPGEIRTAPIVDENDAKELSDLLNQNNIDAFHAKSPRGEYYRIFTHLDEAVTHKDKLK